MGHFAVPSEGVTQPATRRVISGFPLRRAVLGILLNADGPYGHHTGPGGQGDCQDCEVGGCRDCEEGCPDGRCQADGCQDCPGGVCKAPHTGRYGGLAKHHLSADEKAALGASDYGAVTPAGPPTGAVAYPYYTTRGPRDFLAKRPPSIGP